MPLAELRVELARRLRELRISRFHGLPPEDVVARAKERGFKIGAKTIRNWEDPKLCNPTLDLLYRLLALYGTTIGDLFRFTSTIEDSRLVGDLLDASVDKELKDAMGVILSRVKPRKTE